MPINPEIPLQGINPVQTLGDLTKVDNLRSEIMARQRQSQVADQEMEARGLAIDQQRRDTADQQQLQSYMGDPANQEALKKGDLTGIYGKVQPKTAIGLQQHFLEAQKNAAALDETTLKVNTERHNALQSGLQGILALPEADRAQAYTGMVQSMNKSGVSKGLELPQTLPDFSDAALNKLAGLNAVYHGIFEGAQKDKKAAADLAETQSKKAEADALAAKHKAELPGIQAKGDIEQRQADAMKNMTPESMDATIDSVVPNSGDSAQLNARTKAQVKQALAMGMPMTAIQAVVKDASDQLGRTETAVRTAQATAPTKVEIFNKEQASRNAAATPDQQGLDLAAEKYLSDGSIASRNPAYVAAVTTRAAEMARSRGMNAQAAVMEQHAAKANTKALDALTKQYEVLKPFGDMAVKNADVLESAMKNVTDLGAPLLNTPIRDLEAKFGGAKTAAFRAALIPVQQDFVRILGNPSGGGVVTESQRKEIESIINGGATVGQMHDVLGVLKTDWGNRKETTQAAIKDLNSRTVSRGNLPADIPPPPPPPPNSNFRREHNGHIYTRQTEKDQWSLVK